MESERRRGLEFLRLPGDFDDKVDSGYTRTSRNRGKVEAKEASIPREVLSCARVYNRGATQIVVGFGLKKRCVRGACQDSCIGTCRQGYTADEYNSEED